MFVATNREDVASASTIDREGVGTVENAALSVEVLFLVGLQPHLQAQQHIVPQRVVH